MAERRNSGTKVGLAEGIDAGTRLSWLPTRYFGQTGKVSGRTVYLNTPLRRKLHQHEPLMPSGHCNFDARIAKHAANGTVAVL